MHAPNLAATHLARPLFPHGTTTAYFLLQQKLISKPSISRRMISHCNIHPLSIGHTLLGIFIHEARKEVEFRWGFYFDLGSTLRCSCRSRSPVPPAPVVPLTESSGVVA